MAVVGRDGPEGAHVQGRQREHLQQTGWGRWGRCSCDAEEAWGAVAAAYLGVAQEEELLGAEVQVGQRGLPTAP